MMMMIMMMGIIIPAGIGIMAAAVTTVTAMTDMVAIRVAAIAAIRKNASAAAHAAIAISGGNASPITVRNIADIQDAANPAIPPANG